MAENKRVFGGQHMATLPFQNRQGNPRDKKDEWVALPGQILHGGDPWEMPGIRRLIPTWKMFVGY